MKIFIDSANIEEIEEAISWGIVDGVTTNPSLIKKAANYFIERGKVISMEEYLKQLVKVSGPKRPVSLEVIHTDFEGIVSDAKKLFEKFNPVAQNVVIKVPVNPSVQKGGLNDFDGLKAIAVLSHEGIPVNATLIMNPTQAILAAKAGAFYVSPFAGRVDDYIRESAGIEFKKEDYYPEGGLEYEDSVLMDEGIVSGVHLVETIKVIFEHYSLKAEVIAASVRNVRQVYELAETGTEIATIPFSVIKRMVVHEKTYEGMRNFVKDTIVDYSELFK
ncbi:MAG: transaldolase family protein [Caldisericaceae bacterium]